MTLTRALCFWLGGHDLGRVPVWRDGRARLRCQHGCGYETAGIEAAQGHGPRAPVVTQVTRRAARIIPLLAAGRRPGRAGTPGGA
jgi:hypothetical protein